MKRLNKYSVTGMLFVLPAFVYFLLIFLPVAFLRCKLIQQSQYFPGHRTFIGLTNYTNLFNRADFSSAIKITLTYAVITVPVPLDCYPVDCQHPVGHERQSGSGADNPGILPFMVSMVGAGIVWEWLFEPNLGIINNLLKFFGAVNPPLCCARPIRR